MTGQQPEPTLAERRPELSPQERQFIHANGEEVFNAARDRPQLLADIMAMKNWEVRQAAINFGIDMGQMHVGSRQGLGPEQIGRQALLDEMIRRGAKPEEIPGLARPPEEGRPFTQHQKVPARVIGRGGNLVIVLHHELGHTVVSGLNGVDQHGIISHHHERLANSNAVAAASMDPLDLRDAQGNLDPRKAAANLDVELENTAAGVAANELIDGIPRNQNPGRHGDMRWANQMMDAARVPISQRQTFWDAAVDRAIEKLRGRAAEIIKDEATRREDNLDVEWHFSDKRSRNIVERVKREKLEEVGQQGLFPGMDVGGPRAPGGPGAPTGLAGGPGISTPVTPAAAQAAPLKPFRAPQRVFTVGIIDRNGFPIMERIAAVSERELTEKVMRQHPGAQGGQILAVQRPPRKPPGPIFLWEEGEGPLDDMVSREEGEGRLRRKQNRAEGVGDPRNQTRILVDEQGRRNFFGGQLTPEQEKERITTQMDDDEIAKWRGWYPRIRVMFREMYGAGPRADKEAAGWAISQKGVGPARGMMDVERTKDIMGGQRRIQGKGPGMQEQYIREMLSGGTPSGGVGPKLHDFVDSVFERPTRTIMAHRPEGGQPAAIDVHGGRGAGYVDQELINAIEKKFGKEAARGLVVDMGGAPSETQYERSVDYYNNLAQNFNATNFKGGGWNAEQAQSVVWGVVGKQIGRTMQLPDAIFDNNIRRISSEVNPQANSWLGKLFDWGNLTPEQAAAVTRDYTQAVMKIATKEAGGRISHAVYGPGGWMDRGRLAVSPSAGTHLLSSPETAERVANLAGYLMGQQEILISRPLGTGRGHLIEITEVGSTKMAQPEIREAYFQKFNEHYPEATGFAPTRNRDGSVGIQVLQTTGHPTAEQIARADIAADRAADAVGIEHVTTIEHPAEVIPVVNVWEPGQSLNGEAFLNRLKQIGKPGILGRIRNEYRPFLEKAFMDSVKKAITRVREPGG